MYLLQGSASTIYQASPLFKYGGDVINQNGKYFTTSEFETREEAEKRLESIVFDYADSIEETQDMLSYWNGQLQGARIDASNWLILESNFDQ